MQSIPNFSLGGIDSLFTGIQFQLKNAPFSMGWMPSVAKLTLTNIGILFPFVNVFEFQIISSNQPVSNRLQELGIAR